MEKEKELEEIREKEELGVPEAPEQEPAPQDLHGGEGDAQPAPEAEAETPPADGAAPEPPAETPAPEKTFTQEQVNALVGKARAEGREKGYEQARREAFERYGVESDDELDGIFANGSRYEELSSRYADYGNQLRDKSTELALVKTGILPERQADAKAILAAAGLDVTEENIASMLPTHPEWKAAPTQNPVAQAPEVPQPKPATSEPQPNLGPAPKPQGGDGEEPAEARERNEAMRIMGLR